MNAAYVTDISRFYRLSQHLISVCHRVLGDIVPELSPSPRELDFRMEDLKISKKALVTLLEYLLSAQIREGFIIESKLSVVGCFEIYKGNQCENPSWARANWILRWKNSKFSKKLS